MLTTSLVGFLAAVPVLGEAGESCRSNADCLPSLTCMASTCTELRSAVPAVPPPSTETTPVAEVEHSAAEAVEPQAHFRGIHFFLGVSAGAGPSRVSVYGNAVGHNYFFESVVAQVPIELRLGLLFGRFEVAIEGSPASTFVLHGNVSSEGSAALSVGGLIKLYERDGFSLSLPIRARGGLIVGALVRGGMMGGVSTGLSMRIDNALIEARLLGLDYRVYGHISAVSFPFSLSFSWIF